MGPVGGIPLNVSIPLARLTLTAEGVSVGIRPKFLARALVRLLPAPRFADQDADGWSATWDQITGVEAASRSVVFDTQGGMSCRFVVLRRSRLEPVHEALAAHGITVHLRRSTIGRTFRI